MSSAGVSAEDKADRKLSSGSRSRSAYSRTTASTACLAFDKHYRKDGSVNLEKTEFYVPNEYVFELAERYPELFVPNISVNPYRPDAIAELEKWARVARAS
jgi:predicted TIM-barrel fold metal-dependent hydrolase